MRRLRTGSIGSIRAWLPSRRSTRAPQRGLVDDLVGPGAVREDDGDLGAVLAERHRLRGHGLGRHLGSWEFTAGGGTGGWPRAKNEEPPGREGGGRANAQTRRSPYVSRRRSIRVIATTLHRRRPTGNACRRRPAATRRSGVRCPTRLPARRPGGTSSWWVPPPLTPTARSARAGRGAVQRCCTDRRPWPWCRRPPVEPGEGWCGGAGAWDVTPGVAPGHPCTVGGAPIMTRCRKRSSP